MGVWQGTGSCVMGNSAGDIFSFGGGGGGVWSGGCYKGVNGPP